MEAFYPRKSGGMGKEADRLRGENYSSVMNFLRRRFRFDLLKTCAIAIRRSIGIGGCSNGD